MLGVGQRQGLQGLEKSRELIVAFILQKQEAALAVVKFCNCSVLDFALVAAKHPCQVPFLVTHAVIGRDFSLLSGSVSFHTEGFPSRVILEVGSTR